MIDTAFLNKMIRRAGLTKKQFAERLGLSYTGYQARIRRRSEFKASEIYAARDALGLSTEDVTRIFFGGRAANDRPYGGEEGMSERERMKRALRGMIHGAFDSETDCARALGWPKQKLNRIVNGLQEPKLPDVAALGRILGKPEEVREAFVMYWA